MTNCTRIIGTTTALLLTAAASADLQYGDALLSAESNCFAGSDHQVLQQSISFDNAAEVNSSCGGGMTSAYLETNENWFILSAGSTVPGQGSTDEEIPIIIDGGNGAGAVEVEFTIDRPTLFRLSRSIEGSTVRFWEGDYQVAMLSNNDEETPLPKGTYWATIETDQYGTPVWAEIDWQQQGDDKPGDLDDDGKVDGKDLALLISLVADSKDAPSKSSSDKYSNGHPTGGTCTSSGKKDFGLSSSLQVKGTPLPRPKPQPSGDSRSNNKVPHAPTGLSDGPAATTDKGGSDKPAKVIAPTLPKSERKGDLDGDGKVDIRDIVFLMARI